MNIEYRTSNVEGKQPNRGTRMTEQGTRKETAEQTNKEDRTRNKEVK